MPYAWYTAWPPGYYQTCCAQSDTIWARVLHCAHKRWSDTVQPYRWVFPGHWSHPIGIMLSKSNAPTIPTLQNWVSKSEPGTTRGSHQVVQHWQPTDLLALHCKEACIHVVTWIHATTDTAIHLPQQRPPPSNGAANSAGEEQIDLPSTPQGASVQVQRQTRLLCHLHYAQRWRT